MKNSIIKKMLALRLMMRVLAAGLAAGLIVMAGPASAEARLAKLSVDGMVCAFCAQGIEKNLKARAEIGRVFVSLENKVVAVSFKEGKTLSDDQLTRTVVDSGYKVIGITRSDETIEALRASLKKR